MEHYRVFLSSPGDVQQERDRAELIVRRLNAERVDHTQFELVRWEQEYYSATADFQSQIPKPADCDLVVCIFWKRLGTELPQSYTRPDGTIPTGTEFEFESALTAASSRPEKLPDVLVYRKTADVTFSAVTLEFERAQYERFMAFWQRWFYSEKGHFLAGFQSFGTPDEFERIFEHNLRSWLRNREVKVTWTSGSPFRGLEPFDVEHAPIFFGRRREVERTRARLIACATAGSPFLLITGASGSGKSSLARAGLIPRLRQVGALSTLGVALRYAIITPGQIAGDWAGGVARALFENTAIGAELARGDFQSTDELKSQLVRLDLAAALPAQKALKRAGEEIAAKENRSDTPAVVLLILIDQFEELFAWPKAQANAFLQLLKAFSEAPGSPIWLVATMRSDYQHRLVEYPALEALTGRTEVKGPGDAERTLELALPAPADLREMILQPARAAGLSFEVSEDGRRDLAELIDAQAQPEAMPAVQFLLSELYSRRRDTVLTLQAFDELGGVVGVMANRGEEVYRTVVIAGREAFPRIVRALVTQVRGDAPPSARRVPASAFAADAAGSQMIDALLKARLIISDRGELRFTHDSILTGWKRLHDQIAEEQRLFETRERLEQLCRRWVEAGKQQGGKDGRPSKLLLEGFQLAEGRELMAKWGATSLTDRQPELPVYIAASDAREKRTRRLNLAVGWTVALVFAALSWFLYQFWVSADAARKEAQASLLVTKSRYALSDNRISSAIEYAATAFELLPDQTTRSALASALFELSPNLQATFTIGVGADEILAWTAPDTVVFAAANEGTQLRSVSSGKPTAAGAETAWPMPRATRVQDGNRASVRAMRAIGPDRLVAVLDNGAVALIESDAKTAYIRPPSQPMTLYGTAHSAAIGRSGTLIATASLDTDVTLITCAQPFHPRVVPNCDEHTIPDVRGKAVAISPDEKLIAVANETGAVSVYDRSAHRMGAAIPVGGSLLALDWANGRDWIAAGNAEGDIVVINIGAPEHPTLAKASIAGGPITTLSWSPDGFALAFACGGRAICLWLASVGSGDSADFAPTRRFDGHLGSVTRLAWSPAGNQIASASDRTIRIWGLAQNTDAGLTLYADSAAEFTTVATSLDGRWVAGGAKNGTIHLWDASSGSLLRTVKSAFDSEVAEIAWTRSGLLAAAHDDRGITLVPPDVAEPVREIAIDTASSGARIAFVEDDRTLAITRRGDNTIALIDVSGPDAPPRILPSIGPNRSPFGIAADPTGKLLFVSYTDASGAIQIWDIATKIPAGEMAYTLPEKRDPIAGGSLAVSADGRWLATSGGDNYIRIYDVTKKATWRALPIGSNEPQCVAFSPDSKKLAALGSDSRVYVWQLQDGEFELSLSFRSIPERSTVVEPEQRSRVARWLAWVTPDQVAFAAEQSAVNIIDIDPAKWRRRSASVVATEGSAP